MNALLSLKTNHRVATHVANSFADHLAGRQPDQASNKHADSHADIHAGRTAAIPYAPPNLLKDLSAFTIRQIITMGFDNGRSLDALHPLICASLDYLCDAGDQAGLAVRSWLNGNPQFGDADVVALIARGSSSDRIGPQGAPTSRVKSWKRSQTRWIEATSIETGKTYRVLVEEKRSKRHLRSTSMIEGRA